MARHFNSPQFPAPVKHVVCILNISQIKTTKINLYETVASAKHTCHLDYSRGVEVLYVKILHFCAITEHAGHIDYIGGVKFV